jgi:hypothetical protein
VDDAWARLIVLSLADPHLLEGGQRGQDRATNPDAVLALWWGHHLDLHGAGGQSSQLLGHALTDAREHRCASAEHYVAVQVLPASVHSHRENSELV